MNNATVIPFSAPDPPGGATDAAATAEGRAAAVVRVSGDRILVERLALADAGLAPVRRASARPTTGRRSSSAPSGSV